MPPLRAYKLLADMQKIMMHLWKKGIWSNKQDGEYFLSLFLYQMIKEGSEAQISATDV